MKNSLRRGFTLVELIVAIAALAVVGAIGTGIILVLRILWKAGN